MASASAGAKFYLRKLLGCICSHNESDVSIPFRSKAVFAPKTWIHMPETYLSVAACLMPITFAIISQVIKFRADDLFLALRGSLMLIADDGAWPNALFLSRSVRAFGRNAVFSPIASKPPVSHHLTLRSRRIAETPYFWPKSFGYPLSR